MPMVATKIPVPIATPKTATKNQNWAARFNVASATDVSLATLVEMGWVIIVFSCESMPYQI